MDGAISTTLKHKQTNKQTNKQTKKQTNKVTPAATTPRDLSVLTCIFQSFFTTPLALYGDASFRSMSVCMCFYTTKRLSNRNSIVKWQFVQGPGSLKNQRTTMDLLSPSKSCTLVMIACTDSSPTSYVMFCLKAEHCADITSCKWSKYAHHLEAMMTTQEATTGVSDARESTKSRRAQLPPSWELNNVASKTIWCKRFKTRFG